MKKRLLSLLLPLLLLCLLAVSVSATEPSRYLNDGAGVLTDAERVALEERLATIGREYPVAFHILTVTSLDGMSIRAYANEYCDRACNGDAVLLVVDTVGREYYILTNGYGTRLFPDRALGKLENALLPSLSASDYGDAFSDYLDKGVGLMQGPDLSELLVPILVILGVSLLIAMLVTQAMKAKMKTARARRTASNYVRDGSFVVREQADLFLYRTRTRTRIRSSSGGSRSGGGRSGGSRGGRGGRF